MSPWPAPHFLLFFLAFKVLYEFGLCDTSWICQGKKIKIHCKCTMHFLQIFTDTLLKFYWIWTRWCFYAWYSVVCGVLRTLVLTYTRPISCLSKYCFDIIICYNIWLRFILYMSKKVNHYRIHASHVWNFYDIFHIISQNFFKLTLQGKDFTVQYQFWY